MKKRWIVLLSAALCIGMTAVPAAANDDGQEENILQKMEEVNSVDNLLENYGSFSVENLQYEEEGEQRYFFYIDKDRMGREWSDGMREIIDYGQEKNIYVYMPSTDTVSQLLYADDALFQKELEDNTLGGDFKFSEEETVVSDETTAEGRKIITESRWEDIPEEEKEPGLNEGETIKYEYLIDADTYVIKNIDEFFVSVDGEERPVVKQTIITGAERYELPEKYQELLRGKDTYQLSLVLDPGTEEEKTITKDMPKGVSGSIMLPEEYVIYNDEACTQVHVPKGNYEDDQTFYAAKQDPEVLNKIYEANATEELLKNHKNFETHGSEKSGDTELSYYGYFDPDMYVMEDSDSTVQICENGEVFGYMASEAAPYRNLCMEGTYEQYFIEPSSHLICQKPEGEKVSATGEENGMLTVETIMTRDAGLESHPYDEIIAGMDEVEFYVQKYVADPETYEIQECHEYIQRADGTRDEVRASTVTYEVEKYEISQELKAQLDSDDIRTLTLIADPGTDNEKEYTQTVCKGGLIQVVFADGYNTLYTDEACTQVVGGSLDRESDKILYTKKN